MFLRRAYWSFSSGEAKRLLKNSCQADALEHDPLCNESCSASHFEMTIDTIDVEVDLVECLLKKILSILANLELSDQNQKQLCSGRRRRGLLCLSLSINTYLVFGVHTIVYKVNIYTLLKKMQVSLSSNFY